MAGILTLTELLDHLRYEVGSKSANVITNEQGVAWLNWTLMQLASPRVYRHPELRTLDTSLTMTDGTATYTLPTTLRWVTSVRVTPSGGTIRGLRWSHPEQFDRMYPDATVEATPSHWTRGAGGVLRLGPTPGATDDGGTITLAGYTRPTFFDASTLTATSPLGPEWDEALVVGATARAWRATGEVARQAAAAAEFRDLINEIVGALTVESEDSEGVSVDLDGGQPYMR